MLLIRAPGYGMGQGASVQRKGTVRIIGDAQLAAVGAVFQVWTPVELRSILDVFSALTGGTCICSRSRFISEFTCLFGLDESTRSNVFTFFDVNKV